MRLLHSLLLLTWATVAFGQQKQAHKTLKAHEHGSAKLDIAIDGKTAIVQLEAPAISIIGFEHQAKSAADKKTQSAALELLKAKITSMVIVDPAAGCIFSPKLAVVEQEDGEDHSEVRAEFAVTCSGSLPGTKIQFGFTKVFPRLQTVQVQVLNGAQQTGSQIKNDRGSIQLSR